SSTTASAVQVQLSLPGGLVLAAVSPSRALGDLLPSQQQQVTWQVHASGQLLPATLSYYVSASGANAPTTSASARIALPAGGFALGSVFPSAGAASGPLTLRFNGGGFQAGATVQVGGVAGTNPSVAADESSITAAF